MGMGRHCLQKLPYYKQWGMDTAAQNGLQMRLSLKGVCDVTARSGSFLVCVFITDKIVMNECAELPFAKHKDRFCMMHIYWFIITKSPVLCISSLTQRTLDSEIEQYIDDHVLSTISLGVMGGGGGLIQSISVYPGLSYPAVMILHPPLTSR